MAYRTCFRQAGLLISLIVLLGACSPPTRPVAKAVPTETLKVSPELLKGKTVDQPS
ncbi:MAG: hypothetical protein RIR18_1608 [Pseudomonadota bacterium]|jgi:hypothetical protein